MQDNRDRQPDSPARDSGTNDGVQVIHLAAAAVLVAAVLIALTVYAAWWSRLPAPEHLTDAHGQPASSTPHEATPRP